MKREGGAKARDVGDLWKLEKVRKQIYSYGLETLDHSTVLSTDVLDPSTVRPRLAF